MNQTVNSTSGIGSLKLFLSLLLRNLLFSSMAALVVFVFQRKRIFSGEWLGLYPFLCWASLSVMLIALVLSLRGLFLSRWNSLSWDGGREIVITGRFESKRTVLDPVKCETHLGGSVFGMGRKGEIVSGDKHYVFTMGGFSLTEWNALENILVSIQLYRVKGSDSPEVGPPDIIIR
jgi:hypothetical protein